MKHTLIRQGAFETNSSSSHSISLGCSVDNAFVLDTIYPDQNGTVEISGGDYGWEWERHNDAKTKANYLAQYIYGISSKDYYGDIWAKIADSDGNIDIDVDVENSYNLTDFETFVNVIKEHTGATRVVLNAFGLAEGCIDHESIHYLSKNVKHNDPEWIKEFVFNKNSWLFLGNDNSYPPTVYYYNTPTYTPEGEEIPCAYKYRVEIDGLDEPINIIDIETREDTTYVLTYDEGRTTKFIPMFEYLEIYLDGFVINERNKIHRAEFQIESNMVHDFNFNIPRSDQFMFDSDTNEGKLLFTSFSRRYVSLNYDTNDRFAAYRLAKEKTPSIFQYVKFKLIKNQ